MAAASAATVAMIASVMCPQPVLQLAVAAPPVSRVTGGAPAGTASVGLLTPGLRDP